MPGNFFRRSTYHKQCVSNKQKLLRACINNKKIEIDSAASSGGQVKYTKYVSFPWPPLQAAL